MGPITKGYETMEATTPADARDIHAMLQGYPDHFYVGGECESVDISGVVGRDADAGVLFGRRRDDVGSEWNQDQDVAG